MTNQENIEKMLQARLDTAHQAYARKLISEEEHTSFCQSIATIKELFSETHEENIKMMTLVIEDKLRKGEIVLNSLKK